MVDEGRCNNTDRRSPEGAHQPMNPRRIAELQRNIVAADRTGQAYARIAASLRNPELVGDDPISVDVWLTEVARYDALVDEMNETSVAASHELALLERRVG